jgi:hypothetical protein
MAKGITPTLNADAAAGNEKEFSDIESGIRDELCALRCAHGAMAESDNSGTYEVLSYAVNLVDRSLDRIEHLHNLLGTWDMSTRHAHG